MVGDSTIINFMVPKLPYLSSLCYNFACMGITNVSVSVTNLDQTKKVNGRFLVDTGAAYTVLPKKMADKLKLKAIRTQSFSLADGTTIKRKLSSAVVKLDDHEAATTVVIGQKDDSALLGVITLEGMGLMVDPFKRKLRPMKLMLG
ncbi:MAG: hypothetical protein UV54_C0001G0023 [Candidatus Beckwithbacteria bacterium GW2011_GWA2_43_10]|uniref:Aspartyl protease n=1 Tax=Candidatus Beckwithbacteria bacterium GW2011_GWA2_43_10 TaxID=1618369 RepID=A0A0G1F1I0_9BACT|nr:MAG: hypothetical protein UV54_C0001G0023 [Candidatus Beckwithbacteria bacterium GW2011_GWA2_43_10]